MEKLMSRKNVVHKFLDFSEEPDNSPCFHTLDGLPQSGKAKALMWHIISSIVYSQKVIVFFRNIWTDPIQFKNTLKRAKKEVCDYLEKKGMRNYFNLEYTTDPECEEWTNPHSNINVMLLMGNYTQAAKLYKNSEGDCEYNIFIDEADLVINTNETSLEKSFRPVLNSLIDGAKRVVCCTATPLGVLFNDQVNVKCSDTVHLPIPENYHGMDNIESHVIPTKTKNYSAASIKNIFDVDDYLEKYLALFEKKLPYENHPVISLIKNSMLKIHHLQILEYSIKKLKDVLCIVFEGDKIIFSGIKENSIKIKNKKYIKKDNKIFVSKITIQEALQYLKENGNVKKYPRICIVAGKLADRGINFTSSDYNWHITEEYYRTSKSSHTSNLIQSMRVFGISNDTIKRSIYTTDDILSDIKKTYEVTKNIFLDAAKSQEELLFTLLLNKKIQREKMPGRKLTKLKNPFKIVRSLDTSEVRGRLTKSEMQRLTLVQFPKWARDETKIALFMKDLDPKKIYSYVEFKEYCELKNIVMNHLFDIKYANGSQGYGTIILRNEDSTYQLYPELVHSFELNFNFL